MPTNVTHTYDREPAVYAPGELIRLTVDVEVDDPSPQAGRVVTQTVVILPDGTTSEPVITDSQYVVDGQPGTATTEIFSDSTGRTWTRGTPNGNSTVFTTVA